MTPDRDATSLPMDPASILEHLALLPDPRREQGQVHRLDEIVFMALRGVSCGAESRQGIADDSESKLDRLSTFLSLPRGGPSHDTSRRVFCPLDPVAFQGCFSDWMTSLRARHGRTPVSPGRPELRPVAIDGKAQRGSARRTVGRSPSHGVSARAVEDPPSLGRVATDAKSDEITAIPGRLEPLDLEGAVVTINAMGCQKDIAAGIVREEGESASAVKEDQPHLSEDIGRAFDEAPADGEPGVDFTISQTEGVRGGRQETRTCRVITDPGGIRDMGLWTKRTAIGMVASGRVIEGVPSHEVRNFIGSVAGTAEGYLRWVRGPRGIENSSHRVLDVRFGADDQRHWAGPSATDLAWIRKLALSLLRAEPTSKAKSIDRRRHLAGWRDDYLLQVLAQIPQKSDA